MIVTVKRGATDPIPDYGAVRPGERIRIEATGWPFWDSTAYWAVSYMSDRSLYLDGEFPRTLFTDHGYVDIPAPTTEGIYFVQLAEDRGGREVALTHFNVSWSASTPPDWGGGGGEGGPITGIGNAFKWAVAGIVGLVILAIVIRR